MPRTFQIWASVDSTKADAAPTSAISHIQNTAPGPPVAMAVATPAMLPVPTRLAVETISAWNDEMERSPCTCFFSVSCLNMSLMKRICTPLVRMVKYTPTATSRMSRMYVYMKPSISPVISTSHALKSMMAFPFSLYETDSLDLCVRTRIHGNATIPYFETNW